MICSEQGFYYYQTRQRIKKSIRVLKITNVAAKLVLSLALSLIIFLKVVISCLNSSIDFAMSLFSILPPVFNFRSSTPDKI